LFALFSLFCVYVCVCECVFVCLCACLFQKTLLIDVNPRSHSQVNIAVGHRFKAKVLLDSLQLKSGGKLVCDIDGLLQDAEGNYILVETKTMVQVKPFCAIFRVSLYPPSILYVLVHRMLICTSPATTCGCASSTWTGCRATRRASPSPTAPSSSLGTTSAKTSASWRS
jgi:hypothetical protein